MIFEKIPTMASALRITLLAIALAAGAAGDRNMHLAQPRFGCPARKGCCWMDGGDSDGLRRAHRWQPAARRCRERRSFGRQGTSFFAFPDRPASVMPGLQSLLAAGASVNEKNSYG
jgi:hypothetical protein